MYVSVERGKVGQTHIPQELLYSSGSFMRRVFSENLLLRVLEMEQSFSYFLVKFPLLLHIA